MSSAQNPPTCHRYPVNGFPNDWLREEFTPPLSGRGRPKPVISYRAPSGQRFFNKPDLQRALGRTVELSQFDFSTGRFTGPSQSQPTSRPPQQRTTAQQQQLERNQLQQARARAAAHRPSPPAQQPPAQQQRAVAAQNQAILQSRKLRQTMPSRIEGHLKRAIGFTAVDIRSNHPESKVVSKIQSNGASTDTQPQQLLAARRLDGLVTKKRKMELPNGVTMCPTAAGVTAALLGLASHIGDSYPALTGQSGRAVHDVLLPLHSTQPLVRLHSSSLPSTGRQEQVVVNLRRCLADAVKKREAAIQQSRGLPPPTEIAAS